MVEGFDIGAAKGIDRLFGVAHDKQFSRLEFSVAPGGGLRSHLLSEIKNDLVLHGIRILEFIDQQRAIVALQLFTDYGMIAEQRARFAE